MRSDANVTTKVRAARVLEKRFVKEGLWQKLCITLVPLVNNQRNVLNLAEGFRTSLKGIQLIWIGEVIET